MPTEIWGVKGESSGGAGTGGLNGPIPDGDPDGCRQIVSDVAPLPPDTQVWLQIYKCSGVATDEYVLQGDATYTEGSAWRVSKVDLGTVETCVYVSSNRTTELIADGAPGIGEFPATPGAVIICGGYPTCAECSALCYKVTPCSGAPVYYSNSTALAPFAGGYTVINGQCVLVESESDRSQCCPTADNDVVAAGMYASCAACDTATNPTCISCGDHSYAEGSTLTLFHNVQGHTRSFVANGVLSFAGVVGVVATWTGPFTQACTSSYPGSGTATVDYNCSTGVWSVSYGILIEVTASSPGGDPPTGGSWGDSGLGTGCTNPAPVLGELLTITATPC